MLFPSPKPKTHFPFSKIKTQNSNSQSESHKERSREPPPTVKHAFRHRQTAAVNCFLFKKFGHYDLGFGFFLRFVFI